MSDTNTQPVEEKKRFINRTLVEKDPDVHYDKQDVFIEMDRAQRFREETGASWMPGPLGFRWEAVRPVDHLGYRDVRKSLGDRKIYNTMVFSMYSAMHLSRIESTLEKVVDLLSEIANSSSGENEPAKRGRPPKKP